MRTREDLVSPSAASSPPLPVKAQAKLQFPRSVAPQISTAPELKIFRAGSIGRMWFSMLVKSKYIRGLYCC